MALAPPSSSPPPFKAHVMTGSGAPAFTGAPGAHYIDTDINGGIYLCREDGSTWARVDNAAISAAPVLDFGWASPDDGSPTLQITHTVTVLQLAPTATDIALDLSALPGAQRYDIISPFAASLVLPTTFSGVRVVADAGIAVNWSARRLTPGASGMVVQLVMARYPIDWTIRPQLVRAQSLGGALA